MPAFIPPTQPDASFALRFNKSYKYGFCMLYDGETAADLDFSGSDNSSPGRYVVLNINPQNVNLNEPFATSVRLAQGGGKVIERRGQVLKHGTISGQTGFLPAPYKRTSTVSTLPTLRGSLVPNDPQLDTKLAAISGFKAFHDLRYLFRLYGFELRTGRTDVKMYYFDFKNDDFWRIEPDSFIMTRSARKPFTFEYNIAFKCIELADTAITERLSERSADPPPLPVHWVRPASAAGGFFQSIARLKTMVTSGLTFIKHTAGAVQRGFQSAVNAINNVVGFFEDFHDTAKTLFDTALVLLAQADNTLTGMVETANLYAADNIKRELNEWYLEASDLVLHMADQIGVQSQKKGNDILLTNQQFSTGRMKAGATTDLMAFPDGGTATPDANPFTGSSGLGLVTDIRRIAGTTALKTVVVLDGETIYDIARRELGDANRFIDLVIINDLTHPYVVPDSGARPSNTLAYGDYILVPDPTKKAQLGDVSGEPAPTFSHTVSMLGLTNQVIDKNLDLPWRVDQWIGYTITVTHASATESRIVISNTEDTLTVNIAFTLPFAVGDTYTLNMVTFDPRKPVTPDTRAFGTDLLVKFNSKGKCDLVFSSRNDLVWVSGQDNFMQQMMLRLTTEVGDHPFHPSYGVEHPIGRPSTLDVALFYSYFIRRSLLSDPRVQAVKNAQIDMVGDQYRFSANVQPIQTVKARPITVTLG